MCGGVIVITPTIAACDTAMAARPSTAFGEPAIAPADIEALTACIDHVVEQLA